MRKFSAFAVALALVGATLLFALPTSWNGFSVTATPTGGGGYGTLNYPALSTSNDGATFMVIVHYADGPPYSCYYYDSVSGPRSAGTLEIGGGGGQYSTLAVVAEAYCTLGGSSQTISITATP